MKIICIACPRGCLMDVPAPGEPGDPTGYRCERGRLFALQERKRRERVLTTTVPTVFSELPAVPVKTDKPVPLEAMTAFVRAVKAIVLHERKGLHETVMEDVLGTGIRVVLTTDMHRRMGEDPWEDKKATQGN